MLMPIMTLLITLYLGCFHIPATGPSQRSWRSTPGRTLITWPTSTTAWSRSSWPVATTRRTCSTLFYNAALKSVPRSELCCTYMFNICETLVVKWKKYCSGSISVQVLHWYILHAWSMHYCNHWVDIGWYMKTKAKQCTWTLDSLYFRTE